MTPTGFMTDSAFDELAEDMARGVRAMPVVCEHPNWWVLATADGFRAHKMTLKAQDVFRDHKIMLIIEEGDSSHCNQAFDRPLPSTASPSCGRPSTSPPGIGSFLAKLISAGSS